MSLQRSQTAFVNVMEQQDRYRDEVSVLAAKVLESDNSVDIIADFLTNLVFSNVDNADPAEILEHCQSDWDGEDEDNLCDTYDFTHDEDE